MTAQQHCDSVVVRDRQRNCIRVPYIISFFALYLIVSMAHPKTWEQELNGVCVHFVLSYFEALMIRENFTVSIDVVVFHPDSFFYANCAF